LTARAAAGIRGCTTDDVLDFVATEGAEGFGGDAETLLILLALHGVLSSWLGSMSK
jgi:hypothetical protein